MDGNMAFILQPWEGCTILGGVFTCDTAPPELLQQSQAGVENVARAGRDLASVAVGYLLPAILPCNFFLPLLYMELHL